MRHRCTECRKTVIYCKTIAQARTVAREGGCTAVDLSAKRSHHDLDLTTRRAPHEDCAWPMAMVGRPRPGWSDD